MIRHVASIAEVVEDVPQAVAYYRNVLGLEVQEQNPDYALVHVDGALHFGLWARAMAAESVFGDRAAADRVPLGFSIGFEVDDVDEASQELEAAGAGPVQPRQTEPWGQVTSRFFSPSGAMCEFSEMPPRRRITTQMVAGPDPEE